MFLLLKSLDVRACSVGCLHFMTGVASDFCIICSAALLVASVLPCMSSWLSDLLHARCLRLRCLSVKIGVLTRYSASMADTVEHGLAPYLG